VPTPELTGAGNDQDNEPAAAQISSSTSRAGVSRPTDTLIGVLLTASSVPAGSGSRIGRIMGVRTSLAPICERRPATSESSDSLERTNFESFASRIDAPSAASRG
jgi:hypothetical protein